MRDPIRIPKCLEPQTKELRWLLWRWAKGSNGKPTKPPFRADNPSVYAESDNPQTWALCAVAMQAYERGLADGIGYALKKSAIAAIDCDDCRDPVSGVLAPWAQRLLDSCNTYHCYAEVTPSKCGIRIIGKASGAELHRKLPAPDGGSVEVFRDATRYITVSGDTLTPDVEQLGDIDALCDQVVAEFDKKPREQAKTAIVLLRQLIWLAQAQGADNDLMVDYLLAYALDECKPKGRQRDLIERALRLSLHDDNVRGATS
jgi:primase-polymerase (primpol)-like protein